MENNLNKLLEQATAAHTTRRFGLAHRLYESALGLDPDNVEVNRLVGLMNSETGDYAKALPYFEKVLSRDEFNGEIWLAYANTLRKLDRLEEAQVALNFVKKIRSRSDVDHNTVDSFIFDAGKNTNRSLASQSLEVGKHSYGVTDKNIVWDGYQYNSSGEKIKPRLLIGRFCSIGEGAKFFLGGNHRYDWVSTYPFHVQSVHSSTYNALPSEIPGYGQTNGDIIVGNDVWFGRKLMR